MRHRDEDRRRPAAERSRPIEYHEVMELLHSIDQHRAALAADAATLRQWLAISPELYAAWRKFIGQGGIKAADFDLSMGGRLPARPVRMLRHLRLIRNNPGRRRPSRASGPEAA